MPAEERLENVKLSKRPYELLKPNTASVSHKNYQDEQRQCYTVCALVWLIHVYTSALSTGRQQRAKSVALATPSSMFFLREIYKRECAALKQGLERLGTGPFSVTDILEAWNSQGRHQDIGELPQG